MFYLLMVDNQLCMCYSSCMIQAATTEVILAICGAKRRGSGDPGLLCQNRAGYKTPHVGEGRCWLHGGARGSGRPAIHGRYAMSQPRSLAEEAEKLRADPDLLDAEEQAALLKAILRRQVDYHDVTVDAYLDELVEWTQKQEADPDFNDPPPKEPIPGAHISTDVIKLLTSVQKTIHDVHYQKQNSLPIVEVQRILAEVADSFQIVAKEFGIPEAAVLEFRTRIQRVKIASG